MLERVEKPKTLKETALEQLRLAIMIGELAPGERLVERTLCEQLGVSRTVVRECIRHLESEHLVTLSSGGPSVAILERDEIRQIYELRAMFESEAVRRRPASSLSMSGTMMGVLAVPRVLVKDR